MPIATFRGEHNVAEIADNLFARLTVNQRKKVEAEILKANPQLRNISKLRKGSILRVPDMPELRAKITRNLENPDDQVAKDLAGALSNFEERFTERVEVEGKNIKAQIALLNSARFKKLISNSPAMQALARDSGKALEARSKNLGQQQEGVKKAIRKSLDDLDEILK